MKDKLTKKEMKAREQEWNTAPVVLLLEKLKKEIPYGNGKLDTTKEAYIKERYTPNLECANIEWKHTFQKEEIIITIEDYFHEYSIKPYHSYSIVNSYNHNKVKTFSLKKVSKIVIEMIEDSMFDILEQKKKDKEQEKEDREREEINKYNLAKINKLLNLNSEITSPERYHSKYGEFRYRNEKQFGINFSFVFDNPKPDDDGYDKIILKKINRNTLVEIDEIRGTFTIKELKKLIKFVGGNPRAIAERLTNTNNSEEE